MRIDQVGRYILKVLGKASDFVNQKDVLFILMVLLGVTIGILSLIFILWVAKDIAKWYRQRAAKRKAQKALQANKLKDEKEEELKEPWWTKLRRLFSRKKDAVAKSFENTNKILQDIIGGQDYLYTLPWFITMGDARSNKSRLLNSLSFKVPYANNVVESEQPSLHWHYYDNGVVIDFAEEFLFDEKGKAINTAEWQEFLHKLYQHHPERAIDGIVLTFDMGYFYGAFKKEKIDLSVIAKSVYKKLVELQVSSCYNNFLAYPSKVCLGFIVKRFFGREGMGWFEFPYYFLF